MRKLSFFLAIFGVLVILFLFYFLFLKAPSCSSEEECFLKNFQSCKPYELTTTGTSLLRNLDFNGTISIVMKITGNSKNSLCEVSFYVVQISDSKNSWVLNKGMTCYMSDSDFGQIDSINFVNEKCSGNLVASLVKNCEITGTSKTGDSSVPIYKCAN